MVYSMPLATPTVIGSAGTSTTRSSPWKYGRRCASRLGGTPCGYQPCPFAPMTLHRQGNPARTLITAASARLLSGDSSTGRPPTSTDSATSTTLAPYGPTVYGTPSTTTVTGSSRLESSSNPVRKGRSPSTTCVSASSRHPPGVRRSAARLSSTSPASASRTTRSGSTSPRWASRSSGGTPGWRPAICRRAAAQ
ncbi:hypothetical protein [Nonomuraea rubra]|uniref:hypothetical protein n=1 Tax=Nonomuraea rubra TaxID=46180 RepID=UPI0031E54256